MAISTAEAPSEICDALPAWITPSSRNDGLSLASVSGVVPRRRPSSATKPGAAGTGASWPAKSPRSVAAAASSCERAGVLVEGAAGQAPPAGDALGADALVEVAAGELAAGQVGLVALAHERPVRGCRVAAGAERHPRHRLDAARHDEVVLPAHHHARREVERPLARAARAVDRGAGHRSGQPAASTA